MVLELEDSLPGKRLTEDFWRQLPELFSDQHGQKISREMLEWLAKTARSNPDPITTPLEALKHLKSVLHAAVEPELFVLEVQRAPQMRHLPPAPVTLLRQLLNFREIEEVWQAVRSDDNYFLNGRLREDLRETLRVELEPTVRIVREIASLLGL